MAEGGQKWGKGSLWSEEELRLVADNVHLPPLEVAELLPGRSLSAVYNVYYRARREQEAVLGVGQEPYQRGKEEYAVKEPGEYLETLSAYFMEYPECVDIWMRWNGYATYRELCRDMSSSPLGIVTLLCQAKLSRGPRDTVFRLLSGRSTLSGPCAMSSEVDLDKAPGRYVVKESGDEEWPWYWHAYIADVRINGGLARSYAEAIMLAKQYIGQHRRRWRFDNFYWDEETSRWVRKGELPPV